MNASKDYEVCVLEVFDRLEQGKVLIGKVYVEKIVTRAEVGGVIQSETISLEYKAIWTKERPFTQVAQGVFYGYYSKVLNTVNLIGKTSTSGAVFFDIEELKGNRVGTYLMNVIVEWATRWPANTDVSRIELHSNQAYDGNKVRRNQLYEQFGITFTYATPDKLSGYSNAMTVSGLTPVNTWKHNIEEHKPYDYIRGSHLAYTDEAKAHERTIALVDAKQRKINDIERKPYRFAANRLVKDWSLWLLVVILLCLCLAVRQ